MLHRRTLISASAIAAATIVARVFARPKLEKTKISIAVGGK